LNSSSTSAGGNLSPLFTRGTQTPTKVGHDYLDIQNKLQIAYKADGGAGTGQPLVNYKQLDFETESLFAMGSPIGLFLTCR